MPASETGSTIASMKSLAEDVEGTRIIVCGCGNDGTCVLTAGARCLRGRSIIVQAVFCSEVSLDLWR